MDENKTESTVAGADEQRSEEEVAWDQEFKDVKQMGFAESLADMAKLAVKVPVAILQMPLSIIPEETARHTRAAIRETFLAFRSLLGAVGDGIENMLADPEPTDGTWGRGPKAQAQDAAASTPTSSTDTAAPKTGGKSRRIALSDESDIPQPSTEETDSGTTTSPEEDVEATENRGLRADIDY